MSRGHKKTLTAAFYGRPPACCLGWDRSGWPWGQCVIASSGGLPGLHWNCCSWGHWSWWGHSESPQWGMCGVRPLQPSWHLGCIVNAFGDRGPNVRSPAPPRRTVPRDPTFLFSPGLHGTTPCLPALPLSLWPALLLLFPLLSETAHCVRSLGLHRSYGSCFCC